MCIQPSHHRQNRVSRAVHFFKAIVVIVSGQKQHHVPQSLQRGFLFDPKAEKTYVHRRNGGSFPKRSSDVLAQR